MKSVGQLIKESRVKKKISRQKLENETKIKSAFLKAIEDQDWNSLPEYPVVVGFIKKVAGSLDLDQEFLVALLRRDYKKRELSINPKPDVGKGFRWSPRLTFFVGILVFSLIILGYLAIQYVNFINPPPLNIESPKEEEVLREGKVIVSGTTDPESSVSVNNQPVLVGDDGKFSAEIEIFAGTREIVIVALSRSGKETTVRRKIIPELE